MLKYAILGKFQYTKTNEYCSEAFREALFLLRRYTLLLTVFFSLKLKKQNTNRHNERGHFEDFQFLCQLLCVQYIHKLAGFDVRTNSKILSIKPQQLFTIQSAGNRWILLDQ